MTTQGVQGGRENPRSRLAGILTVTVAFRVGGSGRNLEAMQLARDRLSMPICASPGGEKPLKRV